MCSTSGLSRGSRSWQALPAWGCALAEFVTLKHFAKQTGAAVLLVAAALFLPSAAVADSKPLQQAWQLELRGDTPQGIAVDGIGRPYLFVTLKSGGLAVLKTGRAAEVPAVEARIPIRDLGGLDAMHLTQRGKRLYLALGDLFNAQGAKAGLAIVDVATPKTPKVLGVWSTPQKVNGSAIVVVDDKYAYVGAMSEGLMILDIQNPAKIQLVSTFRPDPNFPRPNPGKVQHPNVRGFALDGDRLFVAYDAGGIRVLDVKDRSQPREIGRYLNAGMGQKQQAYNNLILDGDRLFAAIDYAGLEILDVKRPAAIRQLGWWNPWQAHTLQNLWFNSPGHTNQLEYDRQRHLIYLSAGDSELQVVDVSKPNRPELVGHVGSTKDGRGTWGVTVGPDTVYLTYMQALIPFRGTWSGVIAVKRN